MWIDERGNQEERRVPLFVQKADAVFSKFISLIGGDGIEADVLGSHLLGEMKLAAVRGFVSGAAQSPAQSLVRDVIGDRLDMAVIVVADADLAGQTAGHQAEAGGAAHRVAAIGPLKAQPGRGQAIHGRRMEITVSSTAHHGSALLVCDDHQNIGTTLGHLTILSLAQSNTEFAVYPLSESACDIGRQSPGRMVLVQNR